MRIISLSDLDGSAREFLGGCQLGYGIPYGETETTVDDEGFTVPVERKRRKRRTLNQLLTNLAPMVRPQPVSMGVGLLSKRRTS
jgi:hypothetical protein